MKHIIALLLIFPLFNIIFAQDDIVVIQTTEIMYVRATDGLYYIRCLVNCNEFYSIAPIQELYRGFPTELEAINHYLQLWANYSGIQFVPVPQPPSA